MPYSRNHSAPLARMSATLAIVSTLLASVGGAPPSPAIATWAAEMRPSPTSSAPWRYGGATRGNGGRPSTTSSRPVSSPNRYSFGPATMSIATPSAHPASVISAIAVRRAAICSVNVALTATITSSAPTVSAAMSAPSMMR